MMRPLRWALLAVAVVAAAAGEDDVAFATRSRYPQERNPGKEAIVCPLVATAPKLDGTLDDPVWMEQAARTESAFVQLGTLDPVSRHTVAYLCRDAAKLYVTIDCEEPEIEQQDVDNPSITGGDYVRVLIEQGDIRGRGPLVSVVGNRVGRAQTGLRGEAGLDYVCKAGPKRWLAQIGIPFALMPNDHPPLRGELWGLKLLRYGKGSGAGRLRVGWPGIPVISENVVLHGGRLFFESEGMLENPGLKPKDATVPGWTVAAGTPAAGADGALACAQATTLTQGVHAPGGARLGLEWSHGGWDGTARLLAGGVELARAPLAADRLDARLPKDAGEAVVELALRGAGPVTFRLLTVIDDVPDGWTCLTNNDWASGRNLSARAPGTAEGSYTYLKNPNYGMGIAPYRSLGCGETDGSGMREPFGYTGAPTRPPLDAPPPRPDIGEDEVECFPMQSIWTDGQVPDRVGLPVGSYDVGGMQGWIPFSKGSLTGDPSWAGWPSDRWSSGVPHDLVFQVPDAWLIRRVDVLLIRPSFRNLDIAVRPSADPKEPFTLVYRRNGPGTLEPFPWPPLPAYLSVGGIDSVARQVRIGLGCSRPDGLIESGAAADLFGIAEVWIWAEPRGDHPLSEIKAFAPTHPPEQPPVAFTPLKRIAAPIIWPRPKELVAAPGRFALAPGTRIRCGDGVAAVVAKQIAGELKDRLLTDCAIAADDGGSDDGIVLGIAGTGGAVDALLASGAVAVPAHEQAYTLDITPQRVVLVGADAAGLRHGSQAFLQWCEHDADTAFAGCARVRDWPVATIRTIIPSTDHRPPLLAGERLPWHFAMLADAMARFRFDTLVDWSPGETWRSEADTAALVRYAFERGVAIRPALFLPTVPGECIERNPDQQETGAGHIGTEDGTWETANLCPSNPETYRVLERAVDAALRARPSATSVEVGYLGALHGPWNVCPRCRARGLSDGALYADFLNRVGAICRGRGLTAMFTNAFMFSGFAAASAADLQGAHELLNRALVLRTDAPRSPQDQRKAGFWGISHPWSTPKPAGTGGQDAKDFFAEAPANASIEGAIICGDGCNFPAVWAGAFAGPLLVAADQYWGGGVAGKGLPEWSDGEQLAANASLRFNEQLNHRYEYPSWRAGAPAKFAPIDLRAVCTRSHIDEGLASGAGRSGPREGAYGDGAMFDYRRVPLGRNEYAGIPFEVIDPASNGWKSVVLVGSTNKEAQIPGAVARAEIAIGRKVASLCVLRALWQRQTIQGHLHPELITPAYCFLYDDGSRCVSDREVQRSAPQAWFESYNQDWALGVGQTPMTCMWTGARIGLHSNSLSGGQFNLIVNEFVNPYPDKTVAALLVQLPNPEQRAFTMCYHDAIFAVTAVEPTAWDVRFWKAHQPWPLVPPMPAEPPAAKSPLAGCAWDAQRSALVRDGQEVAWWRPIEGHGEPQLVFKTPTAVAGVSFRLSSPRAQQMAARLRHVDVAVMVSDDGKAWTEVARIPACSWGDGLHVAAFAPRTVGAVAFFVDGSAYPDEEPEEVGLLGQQVYGP